ncbi:Potassium channel [Linnemannia hyalina]|uniref:Potassium channel n=1 Tax=Linnemannia hyalina TaxID=64524 RepID=A0A9P8BTU9_9FUNG|nr:Potassium channel [Linnemannia hyalina]
MPTPPLRRPPSFPLTSLSLNNGEQSPAASNITSGSSRPLIRPILLEGHRLVDSADFGSEAYEDEKNDIRLSSSVSARRDPRSPKSNNNKKVAHQGSDNTTLRGGRGRDLNPPESSSNSTISPDSTLGPPVDANQPRPRLCQVGPHIAIATIQSYNILTVVRAVADPTWMVLKSSNDKIGKDDGDHLGHIDKFVTIFLALAITCAFLSCIGFSLRIMDRLTWIRAQYSHGFLSCILTIILSCLVTILLTIDWVRGFPSPGLTIALKELIISSFLMTTVIIIGAATYTKLEGWSFDNAVNFCIVSFSTIGYGNVSPQTIAGRVIFFFYAIIGISAVGYFIVSLRNAVLEQFQWRLLERFSKPAHISRVQTRMSTKDMSFPLARFEEEQRVKKMVKRNMIIRMSIIWIILWFGGAGVFCLFEEWSYLDSLYFCFVTLTTVGFGDMVPAEPGSIEFWNIYVFLGLTVFAYILSLFSATMASHIHLVDDGEGDEEDDVMYGWEQCEDPNNQFLGWNGTLGLEGLKWAQKRQSFKVNQGQDFADGAGQGSSIPGGEVKNDRPKGLQRVRFWNSGGGGGGGFSGRGASVSPLEGQRVSHRPLDGMDQQPQQPLPQQQQQQAGPKPIRRSSSGRILLVPAKERKQMLEAEYYATHGGPPADLTNNATTAGSAIAAGTGAMASTPSGNADGVMTMTTAPATIMFVDKFGNPHQRVIGRRMSYIPEGIQASKVATPEDPGAAATATAVATTTTGGSHPGDQQQQQGYIYSTKGYYDALAKRRGTLAAIQQKHDHKHQPDGGHMHGHDGGQGQGRPSTPIQDQYHHYSEDNTVQTGALEHQPTVRFESPRTRSGNGGTTPQQRATPQRSPQQQQQQQQQQPWQWQQQHHYQYQHHPLSTNPFDASFSPSAMLALQPSRGGEGLRMPWPTVGDNDYELDYDYHITAATSDAFARYLDLDHTRQSHSSDVTKVGSPSVDIHMVQYPFFVDDDGAIKDERTSFSATSQQPQQQQQKYDGGGGGGASGEVVASKTGMQTPPSSRATMNASHGNRYYCAGDGSGGGCENYVGPMNKTRNSEDLPAFAMDVDLNREGAVTTIAQTGGEVVPSSPQSPPSQATVAAMKHQPSSRMSPPPSSFKAKSCSNNVPRITTAMVVDPDLEVEVGPFGEVRDPNRLPKFNDNIDFNHARSCSCPESTPFSTSSKNSNTGGTKQQHMATPTQEDTTAIRRSLSPPAESVTLSTFSHSSAIRTSNNTKTRTITSSNSSNSPSSINPRATTSAAAATQPSPPTPPPPSPPPLTFLLADVPLVGPLGESRQHPLAGEPASFFSLSEARLGAGQGPIQGTNGVDSNRPIQHQRQTTTKTPNPFQTYTNDQSKGGSGGKNNNNNSNNSPFVSFSRKTSTAATSRPLSPPPPPLPSLPLDRKISRPPQQQQQQPPTVSTNPFIQPPQPQWSKTSPVEPVGPLSPPPPASSYYSPSSSSSSSSSSGAPGQGQAVVTIDDDDRKGPFDEPISRNSIFPWFENDVDLNKIGPDPEQVEEARRSVAEIERRTSEKEAKISLEQKRTSSSASASSNKIPTTTMTTGGQGGGGGEREGEGGGGRTSRL